MSTTFFTTLVYSFAYALLYSLWQGLLISALLFLLLKSVKNATAVAKHNMSFAAFVALAFWFADTWEGQFQKLKGVAVYISESSLSGVTSSASSSLVANANSTARFDIFNDYLPYVQHHVPLLMLVYCLGLLFMVVRFIINFRELRTLTQVGTNNPDSKWQEFVASWQQRFGIFREVQLLISNRVEVPMMLGALKPIILLPIATFNHLSAEQVEAILMHELAHIKRHDYLLNMFQTLVETVLFFNPFVWLVSAQIRKEREHCCDDMVVSFAADPLPYANALAMLEVTRANNSLSLAATGNKNQLLNRIKRIMEMKKNNVSNGKSPFVLVAVVATVLVIAMAAFTPSFAQKVKTEIKDTNKKTTTEKKVTVDKTGKKKVITKTTTNVAVEDEDQDQDISVKISVKNTDNKAKVVVVTANDGDDRKGAKKTVKKEYVFSNSDGKISDEIERELAKAKNDLEDIDWQAIKEEMSAALAEVGREINIEKLANEIKIEVKRELADAKNELAEAKKEIANSKKEIAEANAEASIADEGANNIEKMLDKMNREGLIDRSKLFKIEKDGNELYINGKKQPRQVLNRYSNYLFAEEMTIKGSKGNLNVYINN